MTPPGDTLLQFACAPVTVSHDGYGRARNGLFTKHLLRHIATTNKDIEKSSTLFVPMPEQRVKTIKYRIVSAQARLINLST